LKSELTLEELIRTQDRHAQMDQLNIAPAVLETTLKKGNP
jgi:hypothetical protein